jgi:VIT1/CCC1 family predicted Fe2+/Mn2+ transporter
MDVHDTASALVEEELMRSTHIEKHRAAQTGWLRAAVLGANDGIVSVGSLVVGVAAGGKDQADVVLASVAGLVAGAMSMAAGEYVSVRSQADTEEADLAREHRELTADPRRELEELTGIYVRRGLDEPLARRVAGQLMAHDALAAHARDEIGISEIMRARPLEAAAASAAAFAAGALVPLMAAVASPPALIVATVVVASLATLAGLGVAAAKVGGAPLLPSTMRVTGWGMLAMALTAAAGRLVGAAP